MSCVVSGVVATHFHGLYSSLELCCEGPWFTSVQEDGCDNGVQSSWHHKPCHWMPKVRMQIYGGTAGNTVFVMVGTSVRKWFTCYFGQNLMRHTNKHIVKLLRKVNKQLRIVRLQWLQPSEIEPIWRAGWFHLSNKTYKCPKELIHHAWCIK